MPLLPGQEAATPQVVFQKQALSKTGDLERWETEPLFREMDGVGVHEITIEMPSHDCALPLKTDHQVVDVVIACQARCRARGDDARLKDIIISKPMAIQLESRRPRTRTQFVNTGTSRFVHV